VRGEGTDCNENVLFRVLLQDTVQSKCQLTASIIEVNAIVGMAT